MNTIDLRIPVDFLPALFYSDYTGLSDEDIAALDAMTETYLLKNAYFHAIDTRDDCGFLKYHDLQPFGVLASECETVTFDIG